MRAAVCMRLSVICAAVSLGHRIFESPCRMAAEHRGKRFSWREGAPVFGQIFGLGDDFHCRYPLKDQFELFKTRFQTHACDFKGNFIYFVVSIILLYPVTL